MSYLLTWRNNKFIAPDEAIAAHFVSLQENHGVIVKMLQQCDFTLHSYRVVEEQIFVKKNSVVELKEEDEGTGFSICLHLFGYLLAHEQSFQLDNQSFRYCLHESLYKHLCKTLIMKNYL